MSDDLAIDSYSPEQRHYLSEVREAYALVAEVLKTHPECDPQDLFHIAIRMKLPLQERLALGLRRRLIGNAA